jgi:hypothetical protein
MFFVEFRQSDMGPQRTVSERKIFYMIEIPHSLTSRLWKSGTVYETHGQCVKFQKIATLRAGLENFFVRESTENQCEHCSTS